jgi:hypothetical protein
MDCLVPKNHVGFDSNLVKEFEKALQKGVDILKGGEYIDRLTNRKNSHNKGHIMYEP